MRSKSGGAVDVGCAGALHVLDVGLFADVLGAFEHHVLEEMGEAGAAGALVERADVIPEVDGDERQAMVFVGDDDETVGHDELFVLELGDLEGLGRWKRIGGICAGCGDETEQERGGSHAFGYEQRCFHLFSKFVQGGRVEVFERVPAYSNRNGVWMIPTGSSFGLLRLVGDRDARGRRLRGLL